MTKKKTFKDYYMNIEKSSTVDGNDEYSNINTQSYRTNSEKEFNELLRLAGISVKDASNEVNIGITVKKQEDTIDNDFTISKNETLDINKKNVKPEDIQEIKKILILAGVLKPKTDEYGNYILDDECSCNNDEGCKCHNCECSRSYENDYNMNNDPFKPLELPETPYDYNKNMENVDLHRWKIEKSRVLASLESDKWPSLFDDFVNELLQLGFSRPQAEEEVMKLLSLQECYDYGNYQDKPREYHYIGDINTRFEYDLENRYTKAWSADNPLEKGSLEGKLLAKYYNFLKNEEKEEE